MKITKLNETLDNRFSDIVKNLENIYICRYEI